MVLCFYPNPLDLNVLSLTEILRCVALTLGSRIFQPIKWSFTANDGLFYEKRRVVLRETTCRFVGNNGSFFRTQWRENERHGKVQIEKRGN